MKMEDLVYRDIKKLIGYSTEINNLYSSICLYFPLDERNENYEDNLDYVINLIDELQDLIDDEDLFYNYILDNLKDQRYYLIFKKALEDLKNNIGDNLNNIYKRISNYIEFNEAKDNKNSYLDYIMDYDFRNLYINYLYKYDDCPSIKMLRFSLFFEYKILERKYLSNGFTLNDKIYVEYKYVIKDEQFKDNYEETLQEKVIDYCKSLYIKFIEEKDKDKKIVYLCALQSRLVFLDDYSIDLLLLEMKDLYKKNLISNIDLNTIKAIILQSRDDLLDIYYLQDIKKRK